MINLAIVGLGRWGKVLVDAVQDVSREVRFGMAVTRDPEAAKLFCTPRGIVPVGSFSDALSNPKVDAIVLASPHSHHAGQVVECAAARKPVFVEKPFALTSQSARSAIAAARAAGIAVAVGFNRRWLPPIVELKQIVMSGQLGTILHIEANFSGNSVGRYTAESWRVANGESPAGGLAGSGIHHIDAIIHLVAPITEVFAVSVARIHNVQLDDTTIVTFRLADGATASLLTMTATAPIYRLQIFGTKGRAQVDGSAETRGTETLEVVPVSGVRSVRNYPPLDVERAELEAFADTVAGRKPYPVSVAEVLNGVAAFEAVSVSAAKRAVVTISVE